jgi:Ca-activated chloride channel family protein
MAGGSVPDVVNAPLIDDGDPVEGEREIDEDALVLVKIRYKRPGAGERDPATEVQQTLAPGDAAASLDAADPDMRWAVAMAMFAEVLKESPYASSSFDLGVIQAITSAQASRDAYRTEFGQVLARYLGR